MLGVIFDDIFLQVLAVKWLHARRNWKKRGATDAVTFYISSSQRHLLK